MRNRAVCVKEMFCMKLRDIHLNKPKAHSTPYRVPDRILLAANLIGSLRVSIRPKVVTKCLEFGQTTSDRKYAGNSLC